MRDNPAEGGLLDVNSLDLAALATEVDDATVESALDRIIFSEQEPGNHGFSSNI